VRNPHQILTTMDEKPFHADGCVPMGMKDKTVARVLVDREVWRLVKARAALEGCSVAEYVGRILEQYVKRGEGDEEG